MKVQFRSGRADTTRMSSQKASDARFDEFVWSNGITLEVDPAVMEADHFSGRHDFEANTQCAVCGRRGH